jgi:hypothetical protein
MMPEDDLDADFDDLNSPRATWELRSTPASSSGSVVLQLLRFVVSAKLTNAEAAT